MIVIAAVPASAPLSRTTLSVSSRTWNHHREALVQPSLPITDQLLWPESISGVLFQDQGLSFSVFLLSTAPRFATLCCGDIVQPRLASPCLGFVASHSSTESVVRVTFQQSPYRLSIHRPDRRQTKSIETLEFDQAKQFRPVRQSTRYGVCTSTSSCM
ncbi:hypothetical protein BD289DRAFT_79202 [Coniella lustricola]|uniref:Uncharacterized protein n=1 Tax=Coniella lustricola TaxID=2025994 RepID=A0A2T2ZZ81_9PEZI|nr:hypothetical protein BD289DRAFT_79202 [Coniella lustricola]